MFIQVGTRAEGSGALGAGVGLLAAVGAGVLRETGGHAEALTANPAAERPDAAVDALVVLQVGELAETLATCGALVEGSEGLGVVWGRGSAQNMGKVKGGAEKNGYVHSSVSAQTQLQLIFSEPSLYTVVQMQHFWLVSWKSRGKRVRERKKTDRKQQKQQVSG